MQPAWRCLTAHTHRCNRHRARAPPPGWVPGPPGGSSITAPPVPPPLLPAAPPSRLLRPWLHLKAAQLRLDRSQQLLWLPLLVCLLHLHAAGRWRAMLTGKLIHSACIKAVVDSGVPAMCCSSHHIWAAGILRLLPHTALPRLPDPLPLPNNRSAAQSTHGHLIRGAQVGSQQGQVQCRVVSPQPLRQRRLPAAAAASHHVSV